MKFKDMAGKPYKPWHASESRRVCLPVDTSSNTTKESEDSWVDNGVIGIVSVNCVSLEVCSFRRNIVRQ